MRPRACSAYSGNIPEGSRAKGGSEGDHKGMRFQMGLPTVRTACPGHIPFIPGVLRSFLGTDLLAGVWV